MIKLVNLEETNISSSGASSHSTNSNPITNPNSNKFAGMVIVFTGVRNVDMEDSINNGGGKIGTGITGKTTLVIAKDTSESSSKLNTAREKGIQIMNINDFGKKYGFM